MIYTLSYFLIGLALSWAADRTLLKDNKEKLGFLATALFIFVWPFAVVMVVYYMIMMQIGKRH